jgi:hypothetical protein
MATGLQARVEHIWAELEALDINAAGGKPNASGQPSIDHVGYKDGLYRELESIKALVGAETVNEWLGITTGTFTIVSCGDT